MHIITSRLLLRACLVLLIIQAALVDAGRKKSRKNTEEESVPDPIEEVESSDPAESDREARQPQTSENAEEVQPAQPEDDAIESNPVDRAKKSYCAGARSHDGGGDYHPQHGSHGSGHYSHPRADHYNEMEGGHPHGPGYGNEGHGVIHHMSPGHHLEAYEGGEGKGHEGPSGYPWARKAQENYYGGRGGDQYHAAGSAPASVYRPSYQGGHDSYGGGGDYPPPNAYGAPGEYHMPSGPQHDYHYAPHPYAQSQMYSLGPMKSAYGAGAYPTPGSYGPPAMYAPSMAYSAPMYQGPAVYAAPGYAAHGSYSPYMSYGAPMYPMPAYHSPYGYAPLTYSPGYPHSGAAIPVTLTCSLQPQDMGKYPYSQIQSGGISYRSDEEALLETSTNKPLSMVIKPGNQDKTLKAGEKSDSKVQKDEPASGDKKNGNQASGGKSEMKVGAQTGMQTELQGGMQSGMQIDGKGMKMDGARESIMYQRMPFSEIRQRQLAPMLVPKQVFYQGN